MVINIELDDGTMVVYNEVADFYLAVRYPQSLGNQEGKVGVEMRTETYTCTTGALREILKEVRQSCVDLQGEWIKLQMKAVEESGNS